MQKLQTSKVLIRQNCFAPKGTTRFHKGRKVTFWGIYLATLHFYAKTSDLDGFD